MMLLSKVSLKPSLIIALLDQILNGSEKLLINIFDGGDTLVQFGDRRPLALQSPDLFKNFFDVFELRLIVFERVSFLGITLNKQLLKLPKLSALPDRLGAVC